MSNAHGVRLIAAIIGLVLGILFIASIYREVFFEGASRWALLLIVPVLYIMYQLYNRWVRPYSEQPENRRGAPPDDKSDDSDQ